MRMATQKGFGAHATAPSSVFVIEDNDEMRTTLTSILSDAGYKVQASENGREALKLLERTDAPDLIVLDLVMPKMSGWEFRVEQRRTPRLADVPVIVLSADRSAQAMAIDADGYLPKPFDARSLLHAVELRLLTAERRRLDLRASELDRLSALGALAAGIAHEVNSPLAVVAGNVALAQQMIARLLAGEEAPPREALKRVLDLLVDAATGSDRVAAVVRSISTFSHPHDARESVVNVGAVLASSIRLVTNEIRHRARLVCEFDDQLRVLCNPAQLGQVFINILTNAAHAIVDGHPAQHGIRVAGWRTANGRTIVEISDTGQGIARENLERVFDPFFSTKGVGVGIGLGLAVSQRLVSTWGGVLSVKSVLGEGSSFRVDLPSYDAPLAPTLRDAVPPQATDIPTPRVRLMVIDDEPLICSLVANMLSDKIEVVSFSAPRAALAALQEDATFDVILTDLMMPELSGMDLYDEVARAHPELAERIIFMTGGTFTERAEQFLDAHHVRPLVKPFGADEVLHRIARLVRATAA